MGLAARPVQEQRLPRRAALTQLLHGFNQLQHRRQCAEIRAALPLYCRAARPVREHRLPRRTVGDAVTGYRHAVTGYSSAACSTSAHCPVTAAPTVRTVQEQRLPRRSVGEAVTG